MRATAANGICCASSMFCGTTGALVANIHQQSVQLRKLEAGEEENERQLKAQSRAIRDTALLDYYNSEIERLDKLR